MHVRPVILALAATIAVAGCHSADEPVDVVPSSIRLNLATLALNRGEKRPITAEVRSATSAVIPNSAAKILWTSDAPSVAWVESDGAVHGAQRGTATITATVTGVTPNISASVAVTVLDPDADIPTTMRIVLDSAPLWIGDSVRVTAIALNKWQEPITGVPIHWSSDNASVARVSAAGWLLGVARGSAHVFASSGTASGSISVSILEPTAPFVAGTATLVPGAEAQLSVSTFDVVTKRVFTVAVSGWSTSDSSVVRVSRDGAITGGREGVATVTATTAIGTASLNVVTRPQPGTIAYISGNGVWLLALDGSAPVAFMDVSTLSVALAPDAATIAWECGTKVCWSSFENRTVRTVPLDNASQPSWSANGKTLGVRLNYAELAIVPLDGGAVTRLMPHSYIGRPRIGPHADIFAFQCNVYDPYDDDADVCAVDINGRTTMPMIYGALRPIWSSDETRMAYDTHEAFCVSPVLNPRCSSKLPHAPAAEVEGAWSPDGKSIVVAINGDLWLYDANLANGMKLKVASSAGRPFSLTWGVPR